LRNEARLSEESGEWLVGGGEMVERIRSFDWSKSPVGSSDEWSPALQTTVGLMMANRFPMLLWWGPDYISLYNDAYIPILGLKHPIALGLPVRECWSEIWNILKPLIDTPFNGGPSTWIEDFELYIQRSGFTEETHFTVAYSPVPDSTAPSGIGGVLATVHEISQKVVAERRVAILRDLAVEAAESTVEETCRVVAQALARHGKDIPFALLYLVDPDGHHARLAGTAGTEPGKAASAPVVPLDSDMDQGWPLAAAFRGQDMVELTDLASRFDAALVGPWAEPPNMAVILPLRSNKGNEPFGLLVGGVSSRLKFDEQYKSFYELAANQIATALVKARAYEEERKRAEALAEIDRAKTPFFSNVSHEFRTPLTLMLGPIEELRRSPSLDQPGRVNVATAHGNALRLLKLVNSLLDFARVEAGRAQATYQPTDLAAFTTPLASSFESLCRGAGLDLAIDCLPLSQAVYLDRDMWEKIVLNLVSNAFKFTFEGKIAVTLREDNGTAALTVSDTGTGIPEAELPRLFERFHRVEGVVGRTHEGSGIGLALVQELVKMHGGTVDAHSTEGRGSSFMVRIPFGTAHLPRSSIDGQRTQASTATRSEAFVAEAARWISSKPDPYWEQEVDSVGALQASADRPRVLIADDNSDIRGYLQRLLSPYYEIETAENAEAALAAARKHRPDLVLADVMMPGLDGFGLVARLRANEAFRDLPIILLSARAGEEARVEGLAAGADDYLTKPFSARELLARIESNIKLAGVRRRNTAEVQARLREFEALVSATSDAVYRMSPDWTEMRYLLGRDFIVSTEEPNLSWLDAYVDSADQQAVMHAINEAIRTKGVFELEHRVRRVDGSLGWTLSRAIPLLDDHGEVVEWLGTASDVTERRRAQDQQKLLVRELSHRVKNLFAVAGGIVALTARSAKTPQDMASAVRNRLDALARAHELALPAQSAERDTRRRGTALDALVRAICSPYLDEKDAEGILVEGPPTQLAGQPVTSLALVFNELATNAAKYGALSAPGGRIEIRWSLDNGALSLTWTERGGPTVNGRPSGQGFGTLLARRSIEGQLGGVIEYDWAGEGVRVRLSVPAERLSE
jgi:signal transduction histidine kinase